MARRRVFLPAAVRTAPACALVTTPVSSGAGEDGGDLDRFAGTTMISGSFAEAEAQDPALVLDQGASPVLLEAQTVQSLEDPPPTSSDSE
jgi:preprotein translocase subunit SecD